MERTGWIIAAYPKSGGDVTIPVAVAVALVSQVINFDRSKIMLNGAVVDRQDLARARDRMGQRKKAGQPRQLGQARSL